MPDLPPSTLKLEIDHDALAHNWRALNAMSGSAQAGAAIKADCYGLGVDRCLPTLRDAGARDFFVAHWSEVPGAARHIPASQVSVLHGPTTRQEAEYAQAVGARPVIDSLNEARIWTENGGGKCDLMVDTGINRLGIRPEEADDPLVRALDIEVLMSHLACADEDNPMNVRQLGAFRSVAERIPHRALSLANSAGIALGEEYAFDLTRPGLALYGGVPRPELDDVVRQVAYPSAAIIHAKWIEAGETVGYNATFTASRRMRVGTVSLGYADGILRAWGGGALEYDGKALPILGKVSMDMIVIDLSDAPDATEGSWVSLPYNLPDAARQTSVSQYELLTVLGSRFG